MTRTASMLSIWGILLALTACAASPQVTVSAPSVRLPTPTATVLLPLISTAPADRWVNLAPLQITRQEIAVAELGGKIYAFGGYGAMRETLNSAETSARVCGSP